ncbi:hypothetical protein ABMA28_014668 [Loxostege sticticalis]|uniref:C-type lectin domain-containing protein n=1 Tax=Loxostege sticticalis TaxID=481309 RepID=A0ABD0TC71_LOXSC
MFVCVFFLAVCTWCANSASTGDTDVQLLQQNYTFHQEAGVWVKFYSEPQEWVSAALKCFDEGAILASPLSEEIRKVLISIMADNGLTTPMLTGISSVYAKEEYQSIEGVSLSSLCLPWSVRNLNNSVTGYLIMDANGAVTTEYIKEPHPFACYKKEKVLLNECGTKDKEFVLDDRTGSCYKAFNRLATWHEAFSACAKAGAHLAIINSDIEAEIIWELAKRVISEPPLNEKYVYIGFWAWIRRDNRLFWLTVHGQSVNDAGYARWAPKEPNDPVQYCGSVYAGGKLEDGVLHDSTCYTYKHKFICEIAPKFQAVSSRIELPSNVA